MDTSTPVLKHGLILSAITFAIGTVYGKVSLTYFCASDDFIEIHYAAFEDA
jgi:hypothetical protein